VLTFGSCTSCMLSFYVPTRAKISADAVARWATLPAVEKVGRLTCHTFKDCCKNIIMQPSFQ